MNGKSCSPSISLGPFFPVFRFFLYAVDKPKALFKRLLIAFERKFIKVFVEDQKRIVENALCHVF